MTDEAFKEIVEEEWARIPARFTQKLQNVALLIEEEPDEQTREEEGLVGEDTLLGIYRGIPLTERGSEYGIGGTMPDTITLYKLPILEEASELGGELLEATRIVVRETIWHEVGHYFGLDEGAVGEREDEGSNRFEA